MKIDFSVTIKATDGKDIPLTAEKDSPPLTLREVCSAALEQPVNPTTNKEAREKLRRGYLVGKIWGTKEPIELGEEDLRLIKILVLKFWSFPWWAAQASAMLDPEDKIEIPDDPEPKSEPAPAPKK